LLSDWLNTRSKKKDEVMLTQLYRFTILVAMLPLLARGEWVSLNNKGIPYTQPTVTLLQDDHSGTLIKIDLAGFELREFTAGTKTYQSIDLLTDAFTTEAGYPEVPCVAKVLAIPDQAGVSVEVVEIGEVRTFSGFTLPPARPSWQEGDPEPPYEMDAGAYRSTTMYPAEYAKIDAPVIFRDFRIARVAVYPLRYVPEKRELQAVSSITIRVTYGAGEVVNPKTTPKRAIAPSFAALYRSSIFNYQSVLDREYDGLEAGRDVMLCIMPDASVSSFKPYAEWKHKSGIYIRQTKFSDIGATATNPDIIKNHITQAYRTWQYPPTYVLLVGDAGQFPYKNITYGGYTFAYDDYFVEIDGNDYFPEMMIGRFTHDNDYGLQTIVNKCMNYERRPFRGSTAWYKKGIVAANDSYASQLVTKRFVREIMLTDGRFTAVDTFMNHNPCYSNLTTLINTINDGRSFLNYRGEGWYSGWTDGCYGFQTSNVNSVNNGQKLVFFTNIGCGTANFNNGSGNCFGEQWLELGTPTSPRGACAFVGPTSNTHTMYNNHTDKGIYIGLFKEQDIETAAQALWRGKLQMYLVFGNQSSVEYHYRIYHVLGDPSIHIWKDIPRPISVAHPAVLPVGYNQVSMTVADSTSGSPLAGAEITISGDSVYASGFTNASGQLRLDIAPGALDTLDIVVRSPRSIPYEGAIRLTREAEHVGPLGEPTVTEVAGNGDGLMNPNETCRMTVTLKNWGTQTSANVQAILTVSDTNMVRMVTATPVSFGNIASGGSYTGSPYQFFVKPTCPVGYSIPFTLSVSSAARQWTYYYTREVKGCVLSYKDWTVDDLGSPHRNFRIDPGETVKLHLSIGNRGEDVAPNVVGVLRTTDPNVIIIDSVGTFGTIPMDSAAVNMADFFVVSVPDTSLAPYRAPCSILLYTQGGYYPYSIVDTFSLPIGIPIRTDPTGPDAYGYYMYSSDDTLFQQAARFAWTDISSVGTRIAGNGTSEFTVTVTLPFTFKYYGVNYTQTRISSDGWIAFGSGTQTTFENQKLPFSDAVNCMVAPFWDDLFPDISTDRARLHYYNDAAQHRFIVQWKDAPHYVDTTQRETFQVILHNQVYYPTPTGDGEIIFQYRTVTEPGGCTIGIENHTQTAGLSYLFDDDYDITASALTDSFAIRITTQTPQYVVGVKEGDAGWKTIPAEFSLEQNYPNPFNPTTNFQFGIPVRPEGGTGLQFVTLRVYDVLGREVATLVNEELKPGRHEVTFDGTNLASGVYFYRLSVGSSSTKSGQSFVATKKFVLMK